MDYLCQVYKYPNFLCSFDHKQILTLTQYNDFAGHDNVSEMVISLSRTCLTMDNLLIQHNERRRPSITALSMFETCVSRW